MKSTDIFPDCDEEYEATIIECWEEKNCQSVSIEDKRPCAWGDLRRFPLWTIFLCLEKEL